MSSNIKLNRVCQHCSSDFIAKTTVTRYCSDVCAKKAYKARIRAEKIDVSIAETQQIKNKPIEDLKAREFLTVVQVSKLIGCSKQNVYKLINTGKLKATNILVKKTIVLRTDIDNMFKNIQEKPKQKTYYVSECFSISEVQNLFKVSPTALQTIIKRENIPKIKQGKFVYVPKVLIENIFK
ncbi:helix-turn-helix domain-containing protein [Chryseobacterium sp.]|uniref:helix-turn-helix domain-containing protein n=1 Tax=Chryseobacterium sp. TaxID=1871047 RepID=UPI00289BA621|nr:helix-turn-helix domain-containing protein [Chryseobacterium sp.]